MNLCSRDAEMSLIGSMLMDNECIRGVLELITDQDFFFDDARMAFAAITQVAATGEPADLVTVSDKLADQSDNVLALLAEAAKNTPSFENAPAYAAVVQELSDRRKIVLEAQMLITEIQDRSIPVSNTVETYSTRISSIERQREAVVHKVSDRIGREFLQPLDDRYQGIVDPMGWSYGVKDLDNQVMGIHEQDLIVIAGRPSMGKTATINNIIAANLPAAIEQDAPIIDFSMEMSFAKRAIGLVGCMGRIPLDALKNPKEKMEDDHWPKLTYPVSTLQKAPYYMEDSAHSIELIERKVREVYERHGKVGMVLVDYLGLMTGGKNEGSDRTDMAVGERVLRLKKLAKDYNTRVVVLSQLSRRVEQRPNKRPIMSDLIDSGTIEAAADTILFLYRDEYYNKENPDVKGLIELIVRKCREGEVGTVVAAAMLHMGLITDIAPANLQMGA